MRSEKVVVLNLFFVNSLCLDDQLFPPLFPNCRMQNLNSVFKRWTFWNCLIQSEVFKSFNLVVELVHLIFCNCGFKLALKCEAILRGWVWLIILQCLLLHSLWVKLVLLLLKVFNYFKCSAHVSVDLMVLNISLQPILFELSKSIELLS